MKKLELHLGQRFWIKTNNFLQWFPVKIVEEKNFELGRNYPKAICLSEVHYEQNHILDIIEREGVLIKDFCFFSHFTNTSFEILGFKQFLEKENVFINPDLGLFLRNEVVEKSIKPYLDAPFRKIVQFEISKECSIHNIENCFDCLIDKLDKNGVKVSEEIIDKAFVTCLPQSCYPSKEKFKL